MDTPAEAPAPTPPAQAVARRIDALLEGTGIGLWWRNLDTHASGLDERSAAVIGRRLADLGPNPLDTWVSWVHPDDLPALLAARRRPEEAFELDYRIRHADGRWLWMHVRGMSIERDAHTGCRTLVGIHMEVTGRKLTELGLRASEARLRSLFELSPVGIALNDLATGRFLEVNDALVQPTGYTREQLLGLTYWDLTPPEYLRQEPEQLESMRLTDHYGPYEKEYMRRDGSRYPVLLSGVRMTDPDGREVIWSIVQDISARKAMEQELAAAARIDKLTGLANRTLFMERMQHAIERVRHGEQLRYAVLFIDFDRFKLINDTLGHEAGDDLLRQVAARLRHALRGDDADGGEHGNLVARFGGDEFLVLINTLAHATDAQRIAERLIGVLAEPYAVHGRELQSSASIGIVTSEQCAEGAEAVVRNADVAMYEAKRRGRACSVVFNDAMHERIARRVQLENGLRQAIGTRQLSLVYQPIVDVATGEMVSAEALARWEHPQLGAVSPAEFIPIAEETGLIALIGQWVLDAACAAMAGWRRADPARAPRTVSVNISRAELALGPRLLERICEALERHDLPPHCLQVEVTEREVMRDPATSLRLMHDLRRMGVRLAMDDFGTGTSSLACLRDYPFDTIKIDRSFLGDLVGQPDLMAVIHATITLVANLGKASVAEGVENATQLAILQSLSCRQAQGYFFSRPVPASQLLAYVPPATSAAGPCRDTRPASCTASAAG